MAAIPMPDPVGYDFWIAEGTYFPTNGTNQTATFALIRGHRFYGSFLGYDPSGSGPGNEISVAARAGLASNTILSGQITGVPGAPGNTDHIITADGTSGVGQTQRSRIDGLTIEQGYADGVGTLGEYGAGIIFGTSANLVTVTGVTIRDCRALAGGGAVALFDTTDVDFSYCEFESNKAFDPGPGGLLTGRGGAVYMDRVSESGEWVVIFNSRFQGNIAAEGGAIAIDRVSEGAVYLVNLLIHDNSAYAGGGIFIGNTTAAVGGSEIAISHSTITQNDATSTGTAQFSTGGGLHIANANGALADVPVDVHSSIIWGNRTTVDRVKATEGDMGGALIATANVEYCDVKTGPFVVGGPQTLWPGLGNINANPLFVSIPLDDYTLAGTSPCIDAGDDEPIQTLGTATALAIGDLADVDGDLITAEDLPFDLRVTRLREVDIVAVVDTGRNGTGPGPAAISDMGCFEAFVNQAP